MMKYEKNKKNKKTNEAEKRNTHETPIARADYIPRDISSAIHSTRGDWFCLIYDYREDEGRRGEREQKIDPAWDEGNDMCRGGETKFRNHRETILASPDEIPGAITSFLARRFSCFPRNREIA